MDMEAKVSLSCPNMHTSGSKHWPVSSPAFSARPACVYTVLLSLFIQVVLIVSGNLSFLNWLTIVPSLACFDDASLGFLFHSKGGAKKAVLEIQHEDAAGRAPKPTKGIQQMHSHKQTSCFID